jgi:hypothetical protein
VPEISPGGYRYIDYGFFYRYNQAFQDIGNHEGDWEGLTVAPSADGTTFAFAQFSQHGKWVSYLRENLRCDYGSGHSCGSNVTGYKGEHVMTFPSAGAHANYPEPKMHEWHDNENNGRAAWGGNLQESELLPFPRTTPRTVPTTSWVNGPKEWTDWPGMWGATKPSGTACEAAEGVAELFDEPNPCAYSPRSPAAFPYADHGPHFFEPWSKAGSTSCSTEPVEACPSRAHHAQPQTCQDWFGGGIVVLACNRRTMLSALRHRRLERKGRFTIALVNQHRRAATAPGLAQALGHPLRPGETAMLRGAVPTGTELIVQAIEGRRVTISSFAHVGVLHGAASVHLSKGPRGYPRVVLALDGKLRSPDRVIGQPAPRQP